MDQSDKQIICDSPIAAEAIIEAALLTQSEVLTEHALRNLCEPALSAQELDDILITLSNRWQGRALKLVHTAEGWRFQVVKAAFNQLSSLDMHRTPRYSRAVLETLAIIAYQQPVTRSDIEAIRGVSVSSNVLQTLQNRGWIEVISQRDSLGRPNLWATTAAFLSDLQLDNLAQLPPLTELGELILPEIIEPAIADKPKEESLGKPETN